MTPNEAIAIVKSKANCRTCYDGKIEFIDEVLVAEIERLRSLLSDQLEARKFKLLASAKLLGGFSWTEDRTRELTEELDGYNRVIINRE